MSEPTLFRVTKGRKSWSFKIPEQATDFYSPDNGGYLMVKNANGEPVMIFASGAWDTITIIRDNGAAV